MLIFAFLVTALGVYQAVIVPQQSGDAELEHADLVKDDFADVHAAITNAGATNQQLTTTVKLGTKYPSRTFALNPPPVHGRLATDELPGTIGGGGVVPVGGVCGPSSLEPKELTYQADYNVLTDAGHHGYETSVTYHEVDARIVSSTQTLVQGTTIRLLPLTTGTVSTAGIETETLEFHGGTTGGTTLTDVAPVIELPTALSAEQWRTVLADAEKVESITMVGDRVRIELEQDDYTVICTPIGEGKPPNNSPTLVPGGGSGGGSADVVYESDSLNPPNGVTVTVKNLGTTTRTVHQARVPFYSANGSDEGGDPLPATVKYFTSPPPRQVGGPYRTIAPIVIPPGEEADVRVDFFCGMGGTDAYNIADGDFFALSLKFLNGESATYLISPDVGPPVDERCP